MAYFAKLDENNIVTNVISVHDNVLKDENGIEQESKGVEFLRNLYKDPNGVYKQTSYNTEGGIHKLGGTPFRKNYAGIGYKYDADADAFYTPQYINNDGQVYTKWVLNTTTYQWEPPIPYPETYDDGNTATDPETLNQETPVTIQLRDLYTWNDTTGTWDKVSV